jgi:putative transferase (TIGR04331 family)
MTDKSGPDTQGLPGNAINEGARLFLSRIDADFDPARDLALGPWCFIGREDLVPGWEEIEFTSLFDSPDALADAARARTDLARYLVTRLAVELNARHGTEYGFGFWWTMLARWCVDLASSTWRRWLVVEQSARNLAGRELRVPVFAASREAHWNFVDSTEFNLRGLRGEAFDFWLYSLCAEIQAPDGWRLEPRANIENAEDARRAAVLPPTRSNPIRGFFRRTVGRLAFADVPGTSVAAIVAFNAFQKVLPKSSAEPEFQGRPLTEAPSVFAQDYLGMLDLVIERALPKTLGDGFAELDQHARGLGYVRGRLLVTGAAVSNDHGNIVLAHSVEAGERVVRVQHGCDYGTMSHADREALPEYVDSAFLSWGWEAHNGWSKNIIALPGVQPSAFVGRYRRRNDSIIMVGRLLITQSWHIDFMPPPETLVKYRKDKAAFINELVPGVRQALVYRPFARGAIDLEDTAYLERSFPELALHRDDLDSAILSCGLLVLDYPGTTLNLGLAGNVPTVCFWAPGIWPAAAEAAPFFDALAKAGILFDTPAAAAAHVNAIYPNVANWWLSEPVQQARSAWCWRYARASRVWWWHWMRALARL